MSMAYDLVKGFVPTMAEPMIALVVSLLLPNLTSYLETLEEDARGDAGLFILEKLREWGIA